MYDVMGGAVDTPDVAEMGRILDGLSASDDEHPDVSLSHESGWCLSAFASGLLVLENMEDGSASPGEMSEVGRADVLRLFGLLAAGDITALEKQAWRR